MANQVSIMAKLDRNAQVLGLTVSAQTYDSAGTYGSAGNPIVQITDGGNTLTIGYLNASIQSPMGGVDPTVSPYLGIGVANPGVLTLTSSATGGAVSDVIDSATAAQVLQLMSGMANDILLADATTTVSAGGICRLKGTADTITLGQ